MNLQGYEIVRKIGETGHSVLFEAKAEQEEWGTLKYIIKVYVDHSQEGDAAKEVSISQLIENHSLYSVSIPILKKFASDGKVCLLMQQKKSGRFLNEIHDGNSSLRLKDILDTTEKILSSLEVLHKFVYEGKRDRILHLDLHPGNIFVENYEPGMKGTVKFIDFSNAFEEQITDRDKKIDPFPSGYSVFSAPELVENDTDKLCEGTDLYSVASIMFWMMTGRAYKTEMRLSDEIDMYGDRENLPSVIRSAIVRFLRCGFEYNTLYRFRSAFDMKKAVLLLKELVAATSSFDYTQVLERAYDMTISSRDALRIPMEYKESDFSESFKDLEKNMKVYQIDVPRRKYEFDYYWAIVRNQYSINKKIMQRVIRCGIAVCNYASDIALGEELRSKYEEYKDDIPVMEYLNLSAKLAEQDLDKCRYTNAYERDINSLECMKMIKEIYRKCADQCNIKGTEATEYKDLARTYSATGRCVSFMANEYTDERRTVKQNEALQYFKSALAEFGNDAINRQITLCHLLHLAIDVRNKELFEEHALEYFGMSSAAEWFDKNTDNDKCIGDLYKLHLCLRSLYYLYPEEKGGNLSKKLLVLMDRLNCAGSGDPIELVYKYIGLLLYRNSDTVTVNVKKAFQYALNSTGFSMLNKDAPLNIIEIRAYQIWAIYNEINGRPSDTDKVQKLLMKRCRAYGWNELFEKLKKGLPMTDLLSYEYS